MTDIIEMKLAPSGTLCRYPCDICGGGTERVMTHCKGYDDAIADEVHDTGLLVCETCLETGDIEARLQAHINRLEGQAAYLRSLIGRLKVPTFAEWQATEAKHEAEFEAAHAEQAREYAGFHRHRNQPVESEVPF